MTLDFERARFNMVEQQVRPAEVLDPRVLETLREVRREDFVPPAHRRLAFADVALPLDGGVKMLKPIVEGRLLQALKLEPDDSVLEIGTGSGFLTACLARLAHEVLSIDRLPALVERARGRIADAGIGNVVIAVADALDGFEPKRTYDAIAVTGAVADVPERFLSWLAPGGRLFVVRGTDAAKEAVLIERGADGVFGEDSLFETDIDYLLGAEPKPVFTL